MPPKQIIRTTCPRDCYDACGIAVARREDGKIKVLGDPDHPVSRGALCGKCAIAYNGAWLDPKIRLTRPLRRVGAKGEARFEPVTWEHAIGEIAARLKTTVTEHGAESIWHSHYTGTCSLIAGGFPQRFLNRLGASEVEPDSICNAAGHAALGYMYGTGSEGFDPRMAKDAAAILIWGANPHASAPHQHKHWIRETPAKIIVVDPVKHPTAAAAHLHLQPFPGSDAALAFAIAHVLRREGKIDRVYLCYNQFVNTMTQRATVDVLLPLPAVVTADLRLNTPRNAALPMVMKARSKPLAVRAAADFGIDLTPRLTLETVAPPPERKAGQAGTKRRGKTDHLRHQGFLSLPGTMRSRARPSSFIVRFSRSASIRSALKVPAGTAPSTAPSPVSAFFRKSTDTPLAVMR